MIFNRPRIGWYHLPGVGLYHGTIPYGVAEAPAPTADQLVEAGKGDGTVGADVADVDLGADTPQVGDGPAGEGGPAADDEVDGTVDRQDAQGTPRKRAK